MKHCRNAAAAVAFPFDFLVQVNTLQGNMCNQRAIELFYTPRVTAPRFRRLDAARLAWRESAFGDAAVRGSRFSAFKAARERFADGRL